MCSSLDHVGRNELDLPSLSETELIRAVDARSACPAAELLAKRALL